MIAFSFGFGFGFGFTFAFIFAFSFGFRTVGNFTPVALLSWQCIQPGKYSECCYVAPVGAQHQQPTTSESQPEPAGTRMVIMTSLSQQAL